MMKRILQTMTGHGAVLAFILVLAAGGLQAEPPPLPRSAAAAWLALVDQGHYGLSWDEAAMQLMGKSDWERVLKTRREPLGAVAARRIVETLATRSLPSLPDGDYVVLRYETVFDNRRIALETVTVLREEDGRWRVAAYTLE